MSKKLSCCGIYGKKEACGKEFFYALRKDTNDKGDNVTVLYAVDRNGCPIENGNLISLPHSVKDEVLFCCDVNTDLDLDFDDNGVLAHDVACSENGYLG
jgi:hypothetical protein